MGPGFGRFPERGASCEFRVDHENVKRSARPDFGADPGRGNIAPGSPRAPCFTASIESPGTRLTLGFGVVDEALTGRGTGTATWTHPNAGLAVPPGRFVGPPHPGWCRIPPDEVPVPPGFFGSIDLDQPPLIPPRLALRLDTECSPWGQRGSTRGISISGGLRSSTRSGKRLSKATIRRTRGSAMFRWRRVRRQNDASVDGPRRKRRGGHSEGIDSCAHYNLIEA